MESEGRSGKKADVAPLVGAWIEIKPKKNRLVNSGASLPLWERGLKFVTLHLCIGIITVAPLVGAWIEIV